MATTIANSGFAHAPRAVGSEARETLLALAPISPDLGDLFSSSPDLAGFWGATLEGAPFLKGLALKYPADLKSILTHAPGKQMASLVAETQIVGKMLVPSRVS